MDYSWWNLLPQQMDGTLITIGNFPIRYYGLMYLAAFFTVFQTMKKIIADEKLPISRVQLEGLSTWIIVGILLGARFGYIFFYNLGYYLDHPLEIILPVRFDNGIRFTGISGMSYHGGLIGAVVGGSLFIHKQKLNYWMTVNLAFTAAPLGYTWGRIGNFLNGELYGRKTDAAIGMLFPNADGEALRHPSQLYEAFGEGILLFAVMYYLRKKFNLGKHMMGIYLIGYGTVRFIVEFFREPDAHIGLNTLGMSRGQILCAVMIIAGTGLIVYRRNKAH